MQAISRTLKTVGFVSALALLAPFAGAAAQAAAPTTMVKIAVIDTEKILTTSVVGKKALADLKKAQEGKENEIKTRQNEIKDLQDKLSQGRLSLSQDKLSEMDKQIEDKVIALRRLQDDAQRDLTKKKDELLGAIDEKVMPVINKAGKELGYNLIFRKFESGLIYADDLLDITDSIIQRMDAAAAGK